MGGLLAGAAMGLSDGVLNLVGAQTANSQNWSNENALMGIQEQSSNTAYQRAVKDMTAAGINPMLAAQNGGASTVSGQNPTMSNALGEGAAGLMAGVNTAMQAQLTDANIGKVKADTATSLADAVLKAHQTSLSDSNARNAEESTRLNKLREPYVGAEAKGAAALSNLFDSFTSGLRSTVNSIPMKPAGFGSGGHSSGAHISILP